ncbi:MAG TPA: hypothetical protein VFX12_01335 [Vicinamibacterales bacterium]|nr:hypothetical protein [Vicinamibacterales bacterium]
MIEILQAGRAAYAAGLSVLPVKDDGSKAPAVPTWKPFQSTRATPAQVQAWALEHRSGLGVVAGPASGCRECWDFDDAAMFDAFVRTAHAVGLGAVVDRLRAGYEDETPGGGRRWIVTYPDTLSFQDTTLARRPGRDGEPPVKVLIELPTFAIVAPSNGSTHPSGRPYRRVSGDFATIAAYTADERAALLQLARSFDAMPAPAGVAPPSRSVGDVSGDRPGDDFNRRTTWPALLEPHGWTAVFTRGEITYWRRPGKPFGISATTNCHGADLLWVFSSSTPFQPDTSYSKFGAYATLVHGGDFSRAALALRREGFGAEPETAAAVVVPAAPVPPRTLDDVDAVFRRWFGDAFDLDALHVVLAAAAAERLTGDPLWLLVVSGPGAAKTEIVQALAGGGAIVTSTIQSEGALLSGTARRERSKDATGGLLRRLGDHGLLAVKDVTSILSMNRDSRAGVLAALREIHDGMWQRNVGSDGGRSLTWTGRLVVIGAVTTAWDTAHSVIAACGDRFVLVRLDSTAGRLQAGHGACRNTGGERAMRAELAAAVGGLLATVDPAHTVTLPPADETRLVTAANVVTLARTGVEYDYRGDVIDAHAPEMPTRFARQLLQVIRGATAIGLPQSTAVQLAIRAARDSVPPLRLALLDDVAAHPGADVQQIRQRLDKPRATVDRQLQALHMLGLATVEERDGLHRGQPCSRWHYTLATGIDPDALNPEAVPGMLVSDFVHTERETDEPGDGHGDYVSSSESGTDSEPAWVTEPAEPDDSDPIGAHDVEPAARFDGPAPAGLRATSAEPPAAKLFTDKGLPS